MLQLQQIKPKNARSKRELAKREPQIVEHPKTCLFLRYTRSSSLLTTLLSDIYSLKRPNGIRFQKKNAVHPFEDATSFEFFAQKNDTSQLLFASYSKKRPHNLTWVRCFDGHILDMIEFLVIEETARCMAQFKGAKCGLGTKPMLSFSGTLWDDPNRLNYQQAKNILVDFFRGAEVHEIEVEGLQLLITFLAEEAPNDEVQPPIHMRCWRIVTKRSASSKLPKVEVDEIGPRIDFRLGRCRQAEEGRLKEAMRKPKMTEAKTRKNIETDFVGDKMGRIHLGRQDLNALQTRKMKGLKRSRAEVPDAMTLEEEALAGSLSPEESESTNTKRARSHR